MDISVHDSDRGLNETEGGRDDATPQPPNPPPTHPPTNIRRGMHHAQHFFSKKSEECGASLGSTGGLDPLGSWNSIQILLLCGHIHFVNSSGMALEKQYDIMSRDNDYYGEDFKVSSNNNSSPDSSHSATSLRDGDGGWGELGECGGLGWGEHKKILVSTLSNKMKPRTLPAQKGANNNS